MEILINEFTEFYLDTEEFGTYDCYYTSAELAIEAANVLRDEGVLGSIYIVKREVAEHTIAVLADDE